MSCKYIIDYPYMTAFVLNSAEAKRPQALCLSSQIWRSTAYSCRFHSIFWYNTCTYYRQHLCDKYLWPLHLGWLLVLGLKWTFIYKVFSAPEPKARKNKMAALASDWLRHFRLLWNRWKEFNKTLHEARSQRPLPSLCFWGRSVP